MNLGNLSIGQEFKNYPAICSFLGEKLKGGKSKKLQIQEWSRFFKFSVHGRKYRIEDIYIEPKDKVDGRKKPNTNNRVYGDTLEIILTQYLMEKNIEKTSLFYIYNAINITNMNSNNYRFQVKKYEEQLGIEIDRNVVKEFFLNSIIAFASALNSVLRSLEMRGIVKYRIMYLANFDLDGNKRIREATSEEVSAVNVISQNILHEMGYRSESKIYWADKLDEFRNRLQSVLQKDFGINYIYKGYDIELVQFMSENIDSDVTALLRKIKKLFAERFIKNAEERQKRLNESYFSPTDIYSYRVKETYLRDYKLLTDYFINFDTIEIYKYLNKDNSMVTKENMLLVNPI